jgi:katanin p60 ATPase-containing subunit A1
MLRRLEKRVLVDLPTKEARQAMFQQLLPENVIRENNGLVLYSDLDYARLANVRLLEIYSYGKNLLLFFFFFLF